MNTGLAKKIRKSIRKQDKFNLKELDEIFAKRKFVERVKIALKIIFKYRIYKP